jgi:hypothetical protein
VRAQDHVGDELDAEREMLGQHGGGEAGAVAVGGGVEIAADILDRFADLARGAAAGALEHHMLEQVGDAVEPRRLVARAGIGIEADAAVSSPGMQIGFGLAEQIGGKVHAVGYTIKVGAARLAS